MPRISEAVLHKYRHSFWLRWIDGQGQWHEAYYSSAGGHPVLKVDKDFLTLTQTEAEAAGMVEEKENFDENQY